jgi:hypothetical protein
MEAMTYEEQVEKARQVARGMVTEEAVRVVCGAMFSLTLDDSRKLVSDWRSGRLPERRNWMRRLSGSAADREATC